jgi:hypothetical protein
MPAIIIERLLRHLGGTKITLPNPNGGPETEYHFLPDVDGRELCAVSNERHQSILLGIPEGFRFVGPALDLGGTTTPVAGLGVGIPEPQPAPQEPTPQAPVEVPADGFDPKTSADAEAMITWAESSEDNEALLRQMHRDELGAEPRANARVDTMAAKIAAKRAVS